MEANSGRVSTVRRNLKSLRCITSLEHYVNQRWHTDVATRPYNGEARCRLGRRQSALPNNCDQRLVPMLGICMWLGSGWLKWFLRVTGGGLRQFSVGTNRDKLKYNPRRES